MTKDRFEIITVKCDDQKDRFWLELPKNPLLLQIMDIVLEHNLFFAGGFARTMLGADWRWYAGDELRNTCGDIDIWGFRSVEHREQVMRQMESLGYSFQQNDNIMLVHGWKPGDEESEPEYTNNLQLIYIESPLNQPDTPSTIKATLEKFCLSIERTAVFFDWTDRQWKMICDGYFLSDATRGQVTVLAVNGVQSVQKRIEKYVDKGFSQDKSNTWRILYGWNQMTPEQQRKSAGWDEGMRSEGEYLEIDEVPTVQLDDFPGTYNYAKTFWTHEPEPEQKAIEVVWS